MDLGLSGILYQRADVLHRLMIIDKLRNHIDPDAPTIKNKFIDDSLFVLKVKLFDLIEHSLLEFFIIIGAHGSFLKGTELDGQSGFVHLLAFLVPSFSITMSNGWPQCGHLGLSMSLSSL